MRVPIPWVLLLAIAVIGGAWCAGTRHADFLRPPSESKLALIRQQVESSIPPATHPDDTSPAPEVVEEPAPPRPVVAPPPAIDLGDLTHPPTLLEYRDRAPKGAAHLTDLAALLEAKGAAPRALLAWERVLDSAQPDARQTSIACAAILRLRSTLPDWNKDRAATLTITLHARARQKNTNALTNLLEDTARDIEHASAGILKVIPSVTTASTRGKSSASAPIDLWLTGSGKKPATTAVVPCPNESPKTLRDNLLKTIYAAVHGHLEQASVHTPAAIADATKPSDALRCQITRASWHALGTLLNTPPAKHE